MSFLGQFTDVCGKIYNNFDEPLWLRNAVRNRINGPFNLDVYPTRSNAIDMADANWDTLIVLDACRADLFEEHSDLDRFDTYETVVSPGSSTLEWTEQTFPGEYGDIVYVNGNPNVSEVAGENFHKIIDVWRGGFDADLNTVPPEPVMDAAIDAHEAFSDKRIVVHFMQPHQPFISAPDLKFDGMREFSDEPPHNVFHALEMGLVDHDEVWDAYADNLEIVLSSVDDLVRSIEGKIVVTSDHGNLFGERGYPVPLRTYGHPTGIRNSPLVTVPWATITRNGRRDITAGRVKSMSRRDDGIEELDNRLRALGYA
ncbi:alkaline phosphatase family protein [Halomicrobium katesii]|uniref:hypothetical protein n=1 Tax=Halomicrobium katesii TaxID=437163 RepID=UPI00035C7BA9|nr:hypothetical protein [Halomicrobium katesii]